MQAAATAAFAASRVRAGTSIPLFFFRSSSWPVTTRHQLSQPVGLVAYMSSLTHWVTPPRSMRSESSMSVGKDLRRDFRLPAVEKPDTTTASFTPTAFSLRLRDDGVLRSFFAALGYWHRRKATGVQPLARKVFPQLVRITGAQRPDSRCGRVPLFRNSRIFRLEPQIRNRFALLLARTCRTSRDTDGFT